MADVPAKFRNIPVVPVAVALLAGFSLGLAVSIAIDQKARRSNPAYPFDTTPVPCADCAGKQAAASVPVTPPSAASEPDMAPAPIVSKDANVPD